MAISKDYAKRHCQIIKDNSPISVAAFDEKVAPFGLLARRKLRQANVVQETLDGEIKLTQKGKALL